MSRADAGRFRIELAGLGLDAADVRRLFGPAVEVETVHGVDSVAMRSVPDIVVAAMMSATAVVIAPLLTQIVKDALERRNETARRRLEPTRPCRFIVEVSSAANQPPCRVMFELPAGGAATLTLPLEKLVDSAGATAADGARHVHLTLEAD